MQILYAIQQIKLLVLYDINEPFIFKLLFTSYKNYFYLDYDYLY